MHEVNAMKWVDLRSDTVTRPTPAMRQAMANAEVGDDVYGEDPTVNRLEALAADRVGKEAALFVASGTMANLVAILTHCARGDEMIVGDQSHTFLNEAGGAAALGGVQPRTVATQPDGTLAMHDIESAVRSDDVHFPRSQLVCLENTHNRCGGAVLGVEYTREVGQVARRHGLRLHLDGARLFNAAVALGVDSRELAGPADSVCFCLSKGLCAPVGSLVCGTQEFVGRARRIRKQLGGGMRQAGVIAAAGLVALDSMVPRLADDHARARAVADGLRGLPGIVLENDPPPSNMVYVQLDSDWPLSARDLANMLERQGIRIHVVATRRIRLVLHHDIDDEGVDRALAAFRSALEAS
jgi:threonine aldolase